MAETTRLHAAPALAVAAVALLGLFTPRAALAIDWRAEGAAKDAIKKTAADFASSDYATAAARLDKALAGCAGKKCSPGTKAFVLRDLGTMQFRMGDKDAASNSFQQALAIDHDIELSSKYDAPDLRAAWNRAKALASVAPGAPAAEQPVGGDFTHTPPPEQKVKTPLPIYVEPPEGTTLTRVVVKYRGATMSDWAKVELARSGDGWGGMIPCGAVTEGALLYWIQGFDSSGPVASSGDPKHPFTVPIRDEITSDPPSLPDKPPPHSCAAGGSGDEGDSGEGSEGGAAKSSFASGRYARLWVGAGATLELIPMPSADNACVLTTTMPAGLPQNSSNLYCVDANGADFPPRNASGVPINNTLIANPGSGGHSGGGIQPGDVRLMLSVDYALNENFLVGGRMGYVLNSYPGSAASQDGRAAGFKIHIEGRATYLLGKAPLEGVGFSPMGFAGLGLAEFDGHVTSVVTRPNPLGANQAPLSQPVDIWLTDGPFFVYLGAGARYQFSPRIAGTAALRLNIAVGGNGVIPTFGPEFGVQYGF